MIILCQSCFSYKTTVVNDLKPDDYYEMKMKDERQVRGVFQKTYTDPVEFRIKHRLLKYSKNEINLIKRKRTSVLKSLGVFAVMSAGMIISATTNKPKKASDAFGVGPDH